jgi:transcriptional regulator with XRE-family HTH domain
MEEPGKEAFGERFLRLVKAAGLKPSDVVRIVGWKSDSSYYKAARGDIHSINALGLLRLARRLGVSPYYLAGEPEPPSDVSQLADPGDSAGAEVISLDSRRKKEPDGEGPALYDLVVTIGPGFKPANVGRAFQKIVETTNANVRTIQEELAQIRAAQAGVKPPAAAAEPLARQADLEETRRMLADADDRLGLALKRIAALEGASHRHDTRRRRSAEGQS